MADRQITPHFRPSEFDLSQDAAAAFGFEAAPYPEEWIEGRLRPLCLALERIRDACGGRVITLKEAGGYRPAAYDAERIRRGHTGVSPNSQHHQGLAADIMVAGLAPAQVRAQALRLHSASAITLGGVGLYPDFVHIDLRQLLQPGARLALW